ncbi:MAG: hypothetical protein NWE98_02170 [Candidatus Bathyarchaeota archaeon]|nr:hypothetical protein [Candidatus Bathyarchaeota archaeon]
MKIKGKLITTITLGEKGLIYIETEKYTTQHYIAAKKLSEFLKENPHVLNVEYDTDTETLKTVD